MEANLNHFSRFRLSLWSVHIRWQKCPCIASGICKYKEIAPQITVRQEHFFIKLEGNCAWKKCRSEITFNKVNWDHRHLEPRSFSWAEVPYNEAHTCARTHTHTDVLSKMEHCTHARPHREDHTWRNGHTQACTLSSLEQCLTHTHTHTWTRTTYSGVMHTHWKYHKKYLYQIEMKFVDCCDFLKKCLLKPLRAGALSYMLM